MSQHRSKNHVFGLLLLVGITPVAAASCADGTEPDLLSSDSESAGSDIAPVQDLAQPNFRMTDEARIALLEQRYQERLAAHPFNTISGIVRDLDSKPLAGVSVLIGDTKLVTRKDGTYSATLPLGQYLVTFEHPGYVTVQRAVQVELGNGAQLDGHLLPRATPKHFDADKRSRITEGPLTLDFEPGDLAFADGTPVHGDVEITIGVIDPREEGHLLASPAELDGIDAAGNSVLLWSFGMLEVELQKDGKKVQVRPGETVESDFDVEEKFELHEGTKIPMWHQDTKLGTWVQERETDATVVRSPEGRLVASALLPHFSAWNYDGSLGAVCATINIPVKAGTTTVSLKVNSTNSVGAPDNLWSIVAPCQLNTNSMVASCAFNVPVNDSCCHSEVYFRLEGTTNLTSSAPLNVTLVGSQTTYDVLKMTDMRNFLTANNMVAGSWCGNKKFTGLEASGQVTLDPSPSGSLPPNRIRFGYPLSNSPLNIGPTAPQDPGFSSISGRERQALYAANADSDTRNELGSPKDTCAQNYNPSQTDANNNGIGDACEAWCNVAPGPDAEWYDYDLDGIDDMCDNKWSTYNPSQAP